MSVDSDGSFGIAHPTVVPANVDPDAERCPCCGRRLEVRESE